MLELEKRRIFKGRFGLLIASGMVAGLLIPALMVAPKAVVAEDIANFVGVKFLRPQIDSSKFVRFDYASSAPEPVRELVIDDSVDLVPYKTATVSKIAFGRKTEVDIAYTSTGVYSSDGIASSRVQYPGISKFPRLSGDVSHSGSFAYLNVTGDPLVKRSTKVGIWVNSFTDMLVIPSYGGSVLLLGL